MPIDISYLGKTQQALIAPVITHGSFYYFGDVPAALEFIRKMLTAVVEFAPVGYKQLKVTFHGSTSHGRGYDALNIVYDAMSEVRRKMTKGLRVTVEFQLQVSREQEVQESSEVNDD